MMRRPLSLSPRRREGGADRTSFAPLLGEVLDRMSSARAAMLVDSEGETVEHEGSGEPFDLMVAAAHVRIALSAAERSLLGRPRFLAFRGTHGGALARTLADGYALVVLLRARASLLGSRRALDAGAWRISQEAGLACERPSWFPVLVEQTTSSLADSSRSPRPFASRSSFPPPHMRPAEVRERPDGPAYKCTLVGTVANLPARERGYRVRLASRAELTLVREPGDHWYADVPLHGVDGSECADSSNGTTA